MNRKVGLITFVVFLLFIAAGAGAVLALGTSTGVVLGGKVSTTAVAAAATPYQLQAGWIRNNSPWEVTIEAIDIDATGTAEAPVIYLSDTNDAAEPAEGEAPSWTAAPAVFPYTMAGGSIAFLGFSIAPVANEIASFDTIDVTFQGPLPLDFDTSYNEVAIGISGSDLPAELLAPDPGEDGASVDNYVAVLRAALASGDLAQLQRAMGSGTTEEQATALRDSQAGFTAEMPVTSAVVTKDSRSWTLSFYSTDPAVDGLPQLALKWANFRWSAALTG
ncbi:MAG: hypothetical protein JWQ43_2437 [Glaciihabitans sp.]|nr:hypothetical protein [Glaciihabitans sp.]